MVCPTGGAADDVLRTLLRLSPRVLRGYASFVKPYAKPANATYIQVCARAGGLGDRNASSRVQTGRQMLLAATATCNPPMVFFCNDTVWSSSKAISGDTTSVTPLWHRAGQQLKAQALAATRWHNDDRIRAAQNSFYCF